MRAVVLLLVAACVRAAAPDSERIALAALYQTTQGRSWVRADNWLAGDPCDNQWFGVKCNVNNTNVVSVLLFENNLSGYLPPIIAGLTELRNLGLQRNDMRGPLPSSLSSMANLEDIQLYENSFNETVPPLPAPVTLLDLSRNNFTGPAPDVTHMLNLATLALSSNGFTGGLPALPPNATVSFFAANNKFTGGIPEQYVSQPRLNFFFADNNSLSGGLPEDWSGAAALTYLQLNGNPLGGSIPASMGNLSARVISFSNCGLTGSIPPQLSNLANIDQLALDNNKLTGSIPAELDPIILRMGMDNAHGVASGLFLQCNSLDPTPPSACVENPGSCILLPQNCGDTPRLAAPPLSSARA